MKTNDVDTGGLVKYIDNNVKISEIESKTSSISNYLVNLR